MPRGTVTGEYAAGNMRQPVSGDCECGRPAVTRLKGHGPPLCMKCYMRGYARIRQAMDRQNRTSRNYAVDLKIGKPCTDCGVTYPPPCMEWDHVPERGPKMFNLGRADFSMDRVLAEIKKCDLVCACCHRIRTWNRKHPEAPVWLEPVPGAGDAAVTAVSCSS